MRKGMTLIEIIISIALLGIIALGILPAISSQYNILNKTKNITVDSFDSQGEVENKIVDTRILLRDKTKTIDNFSPKIHSFTVLGVNVKAYDLKITSSKFGSRNIQLFLSKQLAEHEAFTSLTSSGVHIDVSTDPGDLVANLGTGNPKLEGKFAANTDSTWYTNVYKWYVSDAGISTPEFPNDYKQISQYLIPPYETKVSDVKPYSNRYVIFSVTPVDKHGVRGSEELSDNRVLVLGPEWRALTFAWSDKNLDTKYIKADSDAKIKTDYIFGSFDAQNPLKDYDNPEINVDIKNSAIYIPRRIDAGTQVVRDLLLQNGMFVNWKADESIHLSTNIIANTNQDINLTTRTGNIILYRFVELDTNGNVIASGGISNLVNFGSRLETMGDVSLISEGYGNIILQPYSGINLANNIIINANGRILLDTGFIKAKSSVKVDTTKNLGILNNRDIQVNNTTIEFEDNLTVGKKIELNSKDKIYLVDSQIDGKNINSILNISSKSGNILDNTIIRNFITTIKGATLFKGGSWDNKSTINVDNSSIIKFEKSSLGSKVNNQGALYLGDTGKVEFASSMSVDLEIPLTIGLTPTGNTILITTNYGRNIGYADADTDSPTIDGGYQDIGTGKTNLQYKINSATGNVNDISSLSVEFNGLNSLIVTGSLKTLANPVGLTLTVKDKYMPGDFTKSINITLTN